MVTDGNSMIQDIKGHSKVCYLGFYFGFRVGVVSKTAKNLMSSILHMHVIGCRSYDSQVELFNVEAPKHLNPDEVSTLCIRQFIKILTYQYSCCNLDIPIYAAIISSSVKTLSL